MNDKQRTALFQTSLITARVSPAAAKMLELIVNAPLYVPRPRRIRIRRDLLPPDRGEQLEVVVTIER